MDKETHGLAGTLHATGQRQIEQKYPHSIDTLTLCQHPCLLYALFCWRRIPPEICSFFFFTFLSLLSTCCCFQSCSHPSCQCWQGVFLPTTLLTVEPLTDPFEWRHAGSTHVRLWRTNKMHAECSVDVHSFIVCVFVCLLFRFSTGFLFPFFSLLFSIF